MVEEIVPHNALAHEAPLRIWEHRKHRIHVPRSDHRFQILESQVPNHEFLLSFFSLLPGERRDKSHFAALQPPHPNPRPEGEGTCGLAFVVTHGACQRRAGEGTVLSNNRMRRVLSEPATKPRRSLIDALLQGRSRGLKRVLRPEGVRATLYQCYLRLAVPRIAVQSTRRINGDRLIIGPVDGQIRDS